MRFARYLGIKVVSIVDGQSTEEQGFRIKQEVIDASPLKALSYQKYRELSQEFSDVGLMTNDATPSPNASCLVMTIEVLGGMLYRGSKILKGVSEGIAKYQVEAPVRVGLGTRIDVIVSFG